MTTNPALESDEKRRLFSQKLTDILNHGSLNLAMGIGYRTGLFDVMDTLDKPASPAEIAKKANLDERYVREWLGVMTCGGIVELSGSSDNEEQFFLPKEHADLITRRAGSSNLGVYMQEIPLLASCALEPVINGFHTGEGVDYYHYPNFQGFMTQLADAKHRETLTQRFLPSVDQGRMLEKLNSGIDVCDLGCGEGLAVLLMAKAFPQSRFTAMDISAKCIVKGAAAAKQQNLNNVSFALYDAADLPGDQQLAQSFDYVTAFDAIHDQTQPFEALKGVHAILKPGGTFSMVDIKAGTRIADNTDHPMGAFLYTVSLMHCMPVGLANNGAGLGMMWGREQAVEMLNAAGFRQIQVLDIRDDGFNLHFMCKK